MSSPPDLDALSSSELKAFVIALLGRVTKLERTVAAQRDEIARLKGVPGRPTLKPSGMEKATQPKPASGQGKRGRGGKKTARRVIHEDRVIKAAVPTGSRFKGHEDFVVQDLVLRPHVVRYRRERWLTPDGQTITAALPAGVHGHFGAELRRFVLVQHCEQASNQDPFRKRLQYIDFRTKNGGQVGSRSAPIGTPPRQHFSECNQHSKTDSRGVPVRRLFTPTPVASHPGPRP